MDSQTRIGAGVIGVLLILFLAILYSRFSGDPPDVDLNIHSPKAIPVSTQGEQAGPRLIQPTIVKDGGSTDLPPEALNPQIATPPRTAPIGPKPGGLMISPAQLDGSKVEGSKAESPRSQVEGRTR